MKKLIILVAVLMMSAMAQACETGHWVDEVNDTLVTLEDGSIWKVADVDESTVIVWVPTTEVIACDDKLINTDDNETVDAVRIR
jgi:hypothetical protein